MTGMEQPYGTVFKLQRGKHDIGIVALLLEILSPAGIDRGDFTAGPAHKVDFVRIDFHEAAARFCACQSPWGVMSAAPPRPANAMHHHADRRA